MIECILWWRAGTLTRLPYQVWLVVPSACPENDLCLAALLLQIIDSVTVSGFVLNTNFTCIIQCAPQVLIPNSMGNLRQ